MRALLFALALCQPAMALAQEAPIRIWGTPAMLAAAERWAEGYRKGHPAQRFEFAMKGSDSAIHGLTGNVADVALMGRENDIVDDFGFTRPKEHPPTRIEIATGSVSVPGKSEAIAVLVNKDNPLGSLTLDQLSRIVDCGGNHAPISTWGQLGLKGAWASAPIRIHSYDFATRTGMWFQKRVTGNDRRMCWDRVTEYADQRRLDGTVAKAADRVGVGARADRFALAIANPQQAEGGLKLVALADGGAPVLPTTESVTERRYPLTRRVYAFVDRKPGTALAPHVLSFLRYALSPEGQALLKADNGYLPLDPANARAQVAILESVK